ncbi:hypothetical protein REPUB_Repub01dG0208700 [Reevesia pubescens]
MPRTSTPRFRLPRLRRVLLLAIATFLISNPLVGFFLLEDSTFWYFITSLGIGRHFSYISPPVKQFLQESKMSSIFHSPDVFKLNYAEMEKRLKIFVYPDGDGDPDDDTPRTRSLSGKYTSEVYFFKNIGESRFLTNDPQKAHLFFIPISCHKMRAKGLSYENITNTVQEYVESLMVRYPFWNRSLGADHFFVTCHDIGLKATVGVPHLVKNSIRVVCTPRDDDGYIPHKDFPLPQIMQPFALPAAKFDPNNRTTLGFWAGNSNSKLRRQLVSTWQNDTELDIQSNRINNATGRFPHIDKFNTAKFCICPGWSQVHGSRIALSIHHGCVPVILSDHYDFPFYDILDWRKFSIIVKEDGIRQLKRTLKRISHAKFRVLHYNTVQVPNAFNHYPFSFWLDASSIDYHVIQTLSFYPFCLRQCMRIQLNTPNLFRLLITLFGVAANQVQRHLRWNSPPIKYDAFHMVMYQLWLRRHVSNY